MSRLTERAVDRTLALLAEHGIVVPAQPRPTLRRTYAGVHQRSHGAWSWYLLPYSWVGSAWSAREVAVAKRLVLLQNEHTFQCEVVVEVDATRGESS